MSTGDFGLGCGTSGLGPLLPTTPSGSAGTNNANNLSQNGIFAGEGAAGTNYYNAFTPILVMTRGTSQIAQLQIAGGGIIASRYREGSTISAWAVQYSTANTTRTSDGTLKAASPVIKLFYDGRYETNEEAEGCTVTRLSAGVYLVEGCDALNSDAAWGGIDGGFDIPTDRNKQPLIWLDYEVNADGSVLVKTFHRRNPDAPLFARNEIDDRAEGDPVDIPADQFVSVRVEMPVESLYNQKMRQNEAELAAGAKG